MRFARLRGRTLEVVGLGLAVVLWVFHMSPETASVVGAGSVGEEIPAFSLPTIDGDSVSRESLRGKVVLVNFWASWCGPCSVEMPGFQRVYHDQKARGFVVLGIWTNDTDAFAMRDLLRESAITYPVAVATADVVRAFGGVRALPISILIDRNGRIQRRVTGIFDEQALRRDVERLLAERPSGHVGSDP